MFLIFSIDHRIKKVLYSTYTYCKGDSMKRIALVLSLLGLFVFALACGDDDDTETPENEGDTDTDMDGDADSDADGDSDTDSDTGSNDAQDGDLWEAESSVMMTTIRFRLTLGDDNTYTLNQAGGSGSTLITVLEEEGTLAESGTTITLTPLVCKEPGRRFEMEEVECGSPTIPELTIAGDTLTAINPEDDNDTLEFTKQ
jgi:hypothetical protein